MMKVEYNVEIPMSDAEDINLMFRFAAGESKTMKFTYDSDKEAISRRAVLKRASDNNSLDLFFTRIKSDVYIEKVSK